MRRTISILFALILATGFILPLAQANWKHRGTNEPDTLHDERDGLMFPDRDINGDPNVRSVYFNVYGKFGDEGEYNANVALIGSRMQPPTTTSFTGLLGTWKDCNNDGYIGMSEYGLAEYRTELLLGDHSICPVIDVGTTVASVPEWYPNNDGEWIREFIFIGKNDDGDSNSRKDNPTVKSIGGSNIWGDWGLPNDEAAIICPLGGNIGLGKTGHMVDYADCLMGYRLMDQLNGVQALTGLPVGGWDKAKPEDSPAFLNVENPAYPVLYGPGHDERSGIFARDDADSNYEAPAFYEAFDCSTSTPSGSLTVTPSGSVYETANDTYSMAMVQECEKPGFEGLFYPRADGTNDASQPFKGKVSADHTFLFSWGARNTVPRGQPVVGNWAPADGGLAAYRDDGPIGPAWRSNTGITMGPQVVNRADLELASARYMTFYARLGSFTGLTMPSTAALQYGSFQCPSPGEGAGISASGWNCDPAAWTKECGDNTPPTKAAQCRVVGETYHMRDIDCWDGQMVRTLPLYASTTPLSAKGTCDVGSNEKIVS